MKTKWTPGLWKFNTPGTLFMGDMRVFLTYRKPIPGWDERLANAKLIAAAPTLAQKLEDAVEWLDREIIALRSSRYGPSKEMALKFEDLRDDLAETLRKVKEG